MKAFTQLRKSACYLAAIIVLVSVLGLAMKGLNLGLDFTGGQLMEFSTSKPVEPSTMQHSLAKMGLNEVKIVASADAQRWTLRLQDTPEQSLDMGLDLNLLSEQLELEVHALDAVYIGSQVGTNMLEQGGLALLVAAIAIMLYLSIRFEWRQAIGALTALLHDVLIVLGIFAWFELSFDLTVMAAILAIIGYSLNDSIVVGDRIRELLQAKQPLPINESINLAVQSTFTRTLITSGTTLATIASIYLLAGKPLEGFSLALIIGVVAGTISSVSLSATLPSLLGLDAEYYVRQARLSELEGEN